jgi:3-dehydroquinate synthase
VSAQGGSSTRSVPVTSSRRGYRVEVGHGTLPSLGKAIQALGLGPRLALVTDRNVLGIWGGPCERALRADGFEIHALPIEAGEAHKTLRGAEALYDALVQAGLGRGDTLVALGGGVVGDLGGFVAATYHRGMGFVQVPTTLLAQVDSSIGGKVAVDLPSGKNLVGAFYPPALVWADVGTLATLPLRERWNGLAEVVKTALIADAALVSVLEASLESLADGTAPREVLVDIVARTAALKAKVVSEDEEEKGPRMHLNFGHTLGHALETVTGHGPLSHGEAVVVGMRAAARVSHALGSLEAEGLDRVLALLARFPRPQGVSKPSPAALLEVAARDKKALVGKVRFVVLDGVGRARVERSLPPALFSQAAAWASEDR